MKRKQPRRRATTNSFEKMAALIEADLHTRGWDNPVLPALFCARVTDNSFRADLTPVPKFGLADLPHRIITLAFHVGYGQHPMWTLVSDKLHSSQDRFAGLLFVYEAWAWINPDRQPDPTRRLADQDGSAECRGVLGVDLDDTIYDLRRVRGRAAELDVMRRNDPGWGGMMGRSIDGLRLLIAAVCRRHQLDTAVPELPDGLAPPYDVSSVLLGMYPHRQARFDELPEPIRARFE